MQLEPMNDAKLKQCITKPRINEKGNSNVPVWLSKRYLLAVILFLAIFMLYAFHGNISIALIEMTKNRTITINGTTDNIGPEFKWNSKVKGLVLSTLTFGGLFSPIAAIIVKKIGGVSALGISLFLTSIITILQPPIARYNFYLFLASRSVEGFIDTFVYISIFEIWFQWAPKKERSKLMAITFTGLYASNAITFPLSGFLAHTWQWPSTFYFTGGVGIAVSTIVLLLFSNRPSDDKYISEKERQYLMQELKKSSHEEVTYPLKEIFTSKPVWALIIAKFCYVCGYAFLSHCLPLYINDMTGLEIHHIGLISGIPNVASIIAVPLGGYFADYLQNKNLLSASQVHKTYIFIGLVMAGICIFIVAIQSNFKINIIFLIFFKIMLSLSYLAKQLVTMNMAPRHAGLIASILSYSILAGVTFTSMLMGFVVTSHGAFQWSIFLLSLGVILIIGGLTFIFFGSSEVQPWSSTRFESDQEPNTHNLLK